MNKKVLLLILGQLIVILGFGQNQTEERVTLNTYPNGQILRERITFSNSDTVIENVYYEGGQLDSKSHFLNNQRHGKRTIFYTNGQLMFEDTYNHGKLNGISKGYHKNGKLTQTVIYDNGNKIDTATYYNETGDIIRLEIYSSPCPRASYECSKKVIIYSGNPVYSYEVIDGLKSETYTVLDPIKYSEIMQIENDTPLFDKGRVVFRQNCAMCHKMDKRLVGPSLNCYLTNNNKNLVKEIIEGENNHPISKLNTKEFDALLEYLKTCLE